MANTYRYVDTTGAVKTTTANTPEEAIRLAGGIASDSGVQLVKPTTPAVAPVTPVVPPTPSPYTTDRTEGSLALEKRKQSEILSQDSQANIQRQAEETAARARQAQIDAINALYAPREKLQTEQASARDARSRALALRTGQLGSGETPYQVAESGKLNAEEKNALANEKQAKIQLAFGTFDEMKAKEAERLTTQATANAEAKVKYNQDLYDLSLKSIQNLGSGGITLEELKTKAPDEYNTLKNVGGLSDFEINQKLQESSQVKYTKTEYNKDLGGLISYGTDPKTGQPVVYTKKIDLGPKETYQEIDGRGFAVTTDANGKLSARPLTTKQYAPNSSKDTATDIKTYVNQQMATPAFKKMTDEQKSDFIRANGGTPSDFDF